MRRKDWILLSVTQLADLIAEAVYASLPIPELGSRTFKTVISDGVTAGAQSTSIQAVLKAISNDPHFRVELTKELTKLGIEGGSNIVKGMIGSLAQSALTSVFPQPPSQTLVEQGIATPTEATASITVNTPTSDFIQCNGILYSQCSDGQISYCPSAGAMTCHSPDANFCNGQYWNACPSGQTFSCTLSGGVCQTPTQYTDWNALLNQYTSSWNTQGYTSGYITDSNGVTQWYRKEGNNWIQKSSQTEAQVPYSSPTTTPISVLPVSPSSPTPPTPTPTPTPVIQPVITTGSATNVTSSSVTLNGIVNPNGAITGAFFQWGNNSNTFGNTTPSQIIGNATINTNVSANLTGLTPATTYYFKIVVVNSSSGAVFGTTQSFTTSSSSQTSIPIITIPVITSISPYPVPAINGQQWITINGSGFVLGLNTILRTGNEVYNIPNTSAGWVSSAQIKIHPNLTAQSELWTMQVVNPNGGKSSNMFGFAVSQ